MLRPAYLAAIAEGSEQIASELHDYIVQAIVGRMMERIGRGEKYLLTSADRWRIQILQDAGEFLCTQGSKYKRFVRQWKRRE